MRIEKERDQDDSAFEAKDTNSAGPITKGDSEEESITKDE